MPEKLPSPGITSEAKVKRVIDGDTLEVTITKTINVRLIDCYCPELHGMEKEDGLVAKHFCQKIIDNSNQTILLHIPTNGNGHVHDILTLNRVLGNIWVKNQEGEWENLSTVLINNGQATPTKSR